MNIQEISWGNPQALLLLPALLLFYIWMSRKLVKDKILRSEVCPFFFKGDESKEIMIFSLSSISLICLSLFFLIISMSKPRIGYELTESIHTGIDIIIAVDVSDSMLAEDVKPDRLTIAKRKIGDLLTLLKGDRIALLSFAGATFIEAPLTLDYGAIKLISETLSTDLVPLKGSDLEAAAQGAITAFKSIESKSDRTKVLILLSDAEFESSTIENSFALLKKEGITPFMLAIGTEDGAPLPGKGGFKRDKNGKVVFSRTNISPLEPYFTESGGMIVRASPTDSDLRQLYLEGIKSKLLDSEIQTTTAHKWNEYFQYPLSVSLFLLLLCWNSFYKPRKKIEDLRARYLTKLRLKISIATFLLSTLTYSSTAHADNSNEIARANSLFNQGKFQESLQELEDLNNQGIDSYHLRMAMGNSYYRLGKFSEASREFGKAYTLSNIEKEKAHALFNRGNALTQTGRLEDALKHYEGVLSEDPEDGEAKQNLSYVKKLLKLEEDKSEDSESDKDQQDNPPSDEDSSKSSSSENDETNENESEEEETQDNSQNEPSEDDNKSKDSQSDKNEPSASEPETPEEEDSEESSSNQDQKPENTKEEEKEQENSANPSPSNPPLDNPEEEPQPTPSNKDKADEKEEDTTGVADNPAIFEKENEPEGKFDQIESQLDSLEENTVARAKYRYKKALEQLKEQSRTAPLMDW